MKKTLEFSFLLVILLAVAWLSYSMYQSYRFKNNPISSKIQQKINTKVYAVESLIRKHFGIDFKAPVIISDKMPSNLYGVASYNQSGEIKIHLNKKRMRESLPYIIEDVIPHEYAHALMFKFGYFDSSDGHSARWQKICEKLEGNNCQRYVDHQDIVSGKLPF